MMKWKVGVLTVSDKGSAGERKDLSGAILKEIVGQINGEVISYYVIPDEQKTIEEFLVKMADIEKCDLILTTGGTGFSPRDVTPEATKSVIHREAPGLPEKMRAETLAKTKFAILSRATAGIRGSTLIINFPGSAKGVRECFEAIENVLPHALQILCGNTEHTGNEGRES